MELLRFLPHVPLRTADPDDDVRYIVDVRTSCHDSRAKSRAVDRDVTPLPVTRFHPTAPAGGKGGPQAHPAGTRSALPAAGAVGEAPAGVGAGAIVGAVSKGNAAVAPVRTQSADGPQNAQKRPTPPDRGQR